MTAFKSPWIKLSKTVVYNKDISHETKMRFLKSFVRSVVIYGCETRTIQYQKERAFLERRFPNIGAIKEAEDQLEWQNKEGEAFQRVGEETLFVKAYKNKMT